jgi:phosphoglycolate phosphatase
MIAAHSGLPLPLPAMRGHGASMARFPFDIVGFDLDGTVLDTSGDLTAAVNYALAEAGRPALTADAVKPMIGGGAKHMLKLTLDATGGCEPEEFRRLYKLLLAYYEDNLSHHTQPFPDAIVTIDKLRARGVKTAIVTNKFEGFARKLLDELKLTQYFDTIIGGDTLGRGREKPAADPIIEMIARLGGGRTVFVGDSIYDTMSAKAAGVPSVGCAFGFLLGPVEDLNADAVIQSYAELILTLERLSTT